MGRITKIIDKYRDDEIIDNSNNNFNELTIENINEIPENYIKDLLTLYNIFTKNLYLDGLAEIITKYDEFNKLFNELFNKLEDNLYIRIDSNNSNNTNSIFERKELKLVINNQIKKSINVIDNENGNYDVIKKLSKELQTQFTKSEENDGFIKAYNKYATSNTYSFPLIGAGPKQNAGGFYPEYPYQPIQVNRNTAIYRFILPVIVFKAFRIILYKKLLEQNKNAFVFKNILTDISLSFALIIALNLMGLSKIASLLFSDLLISVVLIYVVLYMYDCADEKKKEVNIKNIINTLILAPFFVMYVK